METKTKKRRKKPNIKGVGFMENLKSALILINAVLVIALSIVCGNQHNRLEEMNRINNVLYEDRVELSSKLDEAYMQYDYAMVRYENYLKYDETDVNRDGVTDIKDLLIVQKYILGREN